MQDILQSEPLLISSSSAELESLSSSGRFGVFFANSRSEARANRVKEQYTEASGPLEVQEHAHGQVEHSRNGQLVEPESAYSIRDKQHAVLANIQRFLLHQISYISLRKGIPGD